MSDSNNTITLNVRAVGVWYAILIVRIAKLLTRLHVPHAAGILRIGGCFVRIDGGKFYQRKWSWLSIHTAPDPEPPTDGGTRLAA